MIKSALPLLGILLLSGLAYGESVSKPSETTEVDGEKVLTEQYVEARLNTILIQDFNIHKAELSKAIAYLDTIVKPYGLQILYRPLDGREEPVVDLKTRNLPLSRNLSYLSAQGGYDWWVESGVIVIGLPETRETLITEIMPVQSSTVRRLHERGVVR